MNKPLHKPDNLAVGQGEHDAWPLDPAYKVKGSYEDRYREGDNQIVLWEIYRCAKEGSAIPDWAAQAFADLFLKVVKCELSWDQAFGKVPADGHYRTRIQRLAKNLVKVGKAVQRYTSDSTDEQGSNVRKTRACSVISRNQAVVPTRLGAPG